MISLASQLGFVALVFAAGTWYWSDVPWSHFFAAFLGVAVFAVRFAPVRPSVWSSRIGGRAARAARSDAELRAHGSGARVGDRGGRVRGAAAVRSLVECLSRILVGAAAFVATTAAVYVATGKRDLFFLYGNHLDHQSGDVLGAEVAETPTLSLATVPAKLVQLFVDPCFYSAVLDLGLQDGWRRRAAISISGACRSRSSCQRSSFSRSASSGWECSCVRAVRRRSSWEGHMRELRLLVEMTIASSGLVVGYAASTLSGRRTCATGSHATSCWPRFSRRSWSSRLPRSCSGAR